MANLVTWLTSRARTSLLERLADHRTASALRDALVVRRIVVHYQPVVELRSGRVVGLEALCRWDHPSRVAHELVANAKCARMLSGILRLVESIGAVTLVEGVESDSQLEVLRRLGCPYAQGYHLGRPAPADQITALLSRTVGAGRSRDER
ncbi:MAG: EAL domain-containing protein [Actinomycetes bacterium]